MITADGYKTEDIIKNIALLAPLKKFARGKTLFFYELQESSEIL